ncbi:subunits of heterodimeric actin filament capping protein Capz [Wallemia mellicola CBS 633.66]|uniref:Subunits of heterodimeric actin filament capping protein Capz n=1 Tax=Wallemia mellicola (strain ATCC MYA-4683 / CBS 633.66) TaxID=671144 RepID=I4YIV7_WALMC|nr:subunits of heterodimeric actin filament capping protein Capz [Wallemia mellicola CBS 633.66]EIM23899.1 subunits of heterodimeric actin filament capping protein Capz [Wallemia mellicola CBS 633.66]|eukprot:XP_006955741.1 subunits of heterodimeric actin filament capping protein Capz [Wallemia mellicola CBS 633.66]
MSSTEIVKKILKQSPPNELNDVLEDLKVLTDIDQDTLDTCLKEYNEEQFNSIDLDGVRTLITPHSHFEGEKYYDPKSSKLFTLNQLELKTNSAEEVDQLSYKNEARSLLEKSLDSYVEEYFSNGTAAVYTSLKNIQGSLQSQEEQDTVEEAKDSDSNKETARNTENTEMTEAEHGTEEEQNEDNKDKEDKEEQKKDNEDVETPQEQEQEQKEDNEDAEKPEEQPEEPVEDKPIEESKEPEGSVPAETTQVHQETTEDTTENTPSEEITSMNICYAGNKFNQSNYWSGRWRANWVYDLTTNELIGNINITIHYFENGNVQLQASHNPKIKSPLEGPPTTEEEAKKLVKAISESDRAYQAYINVLYEDKLSEKLFRSLRRALPITREKINWDKVVNYKLGSELGKLNN